MKNNSYIPAILLCTLLAALSVYSADGSVLSRPLRAAAGKDTVCNVWVFFNDRPASSAAAPVSRKAALRRQRAGFRAGEWDRPVDRGYIREIERRGGTLRRQFAWGNAASFSVHASRLNDISALAFVKSVTPVAVYVKRSVGGPGLARAPSAASDGGYGWHTEMLNVPLAHDYLKAKELGAPGSGVLMAFFDGGFRLGHTAYSRVRETGAVEAAYDFVDGDNSVSVPDSVVNNPLHPYYQGDLHGTMTLSLAAGYHPGTYIGAAWGARFALARTEDDPVETRVEEDNWAAAAVWAEGLGADIISSSLGYRDGFDDPSEDYRYEDMDGKTTIVAIAAAKAAERGVIVVSAAGNEGSDKPGTIASPADAGGVVGAGAVDRNRVIANFSSTGPTADGRVKPDVVAPGVNLTVPDPYSPGLASYTSNSGTSFAAPLVSGIFALILQANPGISADSAKARLYASCRPVSANPASPVDYRYQAGYGIPDALRAVMADKEIFIKITDSAGTPLQGAQIETGWHTYTANSDGCALVAANGRGLPIQLKITYGSETPRTHTVDSLPHAGVVALDGVSAKVLENPGTFKFAAGKNGKVRGRFFFSGAADAGKPAHAAIRALNGKTIWSQNLPLKPDGSVEFVWDYKNGAKRTAAGVYLLTVRHGGRALTGKIVAAN